MKHHGRAVQEHEQFADDSAFETPWGVHRPRLSQRVPIWLARHSFLHRGKFRHWTTRTITMIHHPLDVVFRDCKFRIEGRNNLIEYGLLLHPTYNAVEINFLLEGLAEGGIAVDIGSNIGLYSLPLARRVGPQGKVIAIDANPSMVSRLAFNAQASGLSQIYPVHAAVGDHDAMINLEITKNDVAIVKVVESESGTIPMHPLMTLLERAGVQRIDVLKIDVEGHEDAALVPFFETADAALLPKRIVIERSGPSGDYPGCAAAFSRHGYQLINRTRSNSLYRRD